MKRTPEQEAARKERRRREATFPKCPCGNVIGLLAQTAGETHCGACRPAIERAEEMADRFEAIRRDARCGLVIPALLALIDIVAENQAFKDSS